MNISLPENWSFRVDTLPGDKSNVFTVEAPRFYRTFSVFPSQLVAVQAEIDNAVQAEIDDAVRRTVNMILENPSVAEEVSRRVETEVAKAYHSWALRDGSSTERAIAQQSEHLSFDLDSDEFDAYLRALYRAPDRGMLVYLFKAGMDYERRRNV